MGLKPSPYWCIKLLLLALETIRGDPTNPSNPFHWSETRLNLPGQIDYDPSKPKLQRVQGNSAELAAFILSYVDDMRVGSPEAGLCWEVLHLVSSMTAYLGIQVASRKTRPPSPHPGPWAGAMVVLDDTGVGVKATADKWKKTKELLQHTQSLLDLGDHIDRKLLESYRGSLVYLQRTYPAITPYVKGFHLTIDGWRPDRDSFGWKIKDAAQSATHLEPPPFVTPVPRLRADISSLLRLFEGDEPPIRWVRGHHVAEVTYSFADASRSGYGQSLSTQDGIHYTHGVWDEATMEQTSNYWELAYLVHTLEDGVASGRLSHSEVWIFTDNTTAEGVFWKGHSPYPHLNELALRLRMLEMDGLVRIQNGARPRGQNDQPRNRWAIPGGFVGGRDDGSVNVAACPSAVFGDRAPAISSPMGYVMAPLHPLHPRTQPVECGGTWSVGWVGRSVQCLAPIPPAL